ncbi:MAG: SO_0444 family Cu/Zn efflux transporter [Anaerohalosphaera sp.]|nr:SO_0444 family Cu/Zn efflux transporter [Anaerohalosphaera sp.]
MSEKILVLAAQFWATLTAMSPYLLFGFFVAGVLSVFISPKLVESHLGSRGLGPVIKASLFGVPLPLCSCGVIPVAMSLRKHGASKAASISFLLSTPQTGIDSLLVTYSLLGPIFALVRPLIAFVTGVIGGVAVEFVNSTASSDIKADADQEKCTDDCCNAKQETKLKRILKHGFVTLPKDIGKPMLLGLVIAALISAFVPADFFADRIGSGIGAMLLMMLLGIPVYVCATASVPIAAMMIVKGLSPGAALVFLMTGPATNAAALATIWNAMGRRTAIVYLLTVASCALASGLLLDAMFPNLIFEVTDHMHEMTTALWQHLAAVVLLIVLGTAMFSDKIKAAGGKKDDCRCSSK